MRTGSRLVAVAMVFAFGVTGFAHAAAVKVAAPKKISFTVTQTSASLRWGLTSGPAPSKVIIVCTADDESKVTASTKHSSVTVRGLKVGTDYTCTLSARLGKLKSATKSVAFSTLPATIAARPTNVVATAGRQSATITWTAPTNNGGSAVISYRVSSTPTSIGCTTTTTSCQIAGLSSNDEYVFQVVAINGVGPSLRSLPSAGVTPLAPLNSVSNVVAAPGDGYVDLSWNLAGTVDSIAVTWGDSATDIAGNATSYRVSALPNCTPVSISMRSIINTQSSDAVTTTATPGLGIALPSSVINLAADASSRQVSVSFTKPSDDIAITRYDLTASDGTNVISRSITPNSGDTSFTSVFTDLTNDVQYTFTVVAVNGCGTRIATSADRVTATPNWAARPATVIDLDDPNAVTAVEVAVGHSVGYHFTALETFATTGVYFAFEPQCSSNGVVWSDCPVGVSVQLYTVDGSQLDVVQYSYSLWNGIGLIPVRPSVPLTEDAEYIIVLTLNSSPQAHTSIDVLSEALVW